MQNISTGKKTVVVLGLGVYFFILFQVVLFAGLAFFSFCFGGFLFGFFWGDCYFLVCFGFSECMRFFVVFSF